MTYRGYIKDGQIRLNKPALLPEGAQVNIEVIEPIAPSSKPKHPPRARRFQPIEMPGGSLAEELIRDRR